MNRAVLLAWPPYEGPVRRLHHYRPCPDRQAQENACCLRLVVGACLRRQPVVGQQVAELTEQGYAEHEIARYLGLTRKVVRGWKERLKQALCLCLGLKGR